MRLCRMLLVIIVIGLICVACGGGDGTDDYTTVLISEINTGIEGNNLYDYIELYNPESIPFDLHGFNLIYQLKEGNDEITIAHWGEETLIPPYGHYLLGIEGQDYGVPVDYFIEQSFVPSRGGLDLRFGVKTIDKVAWGTSSSDMQEKKFIEEVELGSSMERLPGGEEGNGQDSDNNRKDFFASTSPNPQNTGSAITPGYENEIGFSIEYPQTVKPGKEFGYQLVVENLSDVIMNDVQVSFPHDYGLEIVSVDDGIVQTENGFVWEVGHLEAGETVLVSINFIAPLTFMEIDVINSYAKVGDWEGASFAGTLNTSVEGGSIPIATARELIGMEVVVEGTSTMYNGGFFAGSGAKFYIEDETSGVQVYVPEAGESLKLPIGAYVQVRGVITLYRGAIEIIPPSEALVTVLESPANWDERAPEVISVGTASNDRSYMANFVQVEGVVARIEEFSYSSEVDIVDDAGQLVTLYVDKETGISLDEIESGDSYKVNGIIEILDSLQRVYPRQQSDFEKIYPPILDIQVNAPNLVSVGESFEIVFEVYNYTPDVMTNVEIDYVFDENLLVIDEIQDIGGYEESNHIMWAAGDLAGDGEMTTVSLSAHVEGDAEMLSIGGYYAISDQWLEPVVGEEFFTFFGTSVPIWAIQGSGQKSAYISELVETSGVVTGVFPDFNGFWIQELNSDDDLNTSAGIFVSHGPASVDVEIGDLVSVEGIVREVQRETRIELMGVSGLVVISEGNVLPEITELNPPADNEESIVYFEALEGMLVSVSGSATVVGPTNRYGEFSIILDQHGMDRVFHTDDTGMIIRVDDGTNSVHEFQETMVTAVSQGDSVNGIFGPLSFTYGNYKVEPIEEYSVEKQSVNLPTMLMLGSDEFSIMSWNVENLFDFVDPHPTSPSMPTVGEFKDSIAKIANTIISAGAPTVIGFQEVENIDVLMDITEHEILESFGYVAVLIEGTDSRGIDVGYLVNTDNVEIVIEEQYPGPEGITSRPPLLVKLQIELANGSVELFVLNNHFTSMSGGEKATEPRRNAQADWNVEVYYGIIADNPEANLAVIGDLNSYYSALPIDTLRNAGLIHVFDTLDADERYTYVFQGISQVLDHIIVTEDLMALLTDVVILHTNADYVLPAEGDETPLHKSDHDPVIAIFQLP